MYFLGILSTVSYAHNASMICIMMLRAPVTFDFCVELLVNLFRRSDFHIVAIIIAICNSNNTNYPRIS